MAQDKIKL